MAKESFYEQMKRLGLWDKPIGELANVIDEKDKAIAEKDKDYGRIFLRQPISSVSSNQRSSSSSISACCSLIFFIRSPRPS